jgi:hypothetical protein
MKFCLTRKRRAATDLLQRFADQNANEIAASIFRVV